MKLNCVPRAGFCYLLLFLLPGIVFAQAKSLGTPPSDADRQLLDQLVARYYEKQRILTEKQLLLATIQPQIARLETIQSIAALGAGPRTTVSKIRQAFPDEFVSMATEVAYALSLRRTVLAPEVFRSTLRQAGFSANETEAAIKNHAGLPEKLTSQKQLEEIEVRQLSQAIAEIRAQVGMIAPKVGLKPDVLLGSGN
ncbi:MAG: hypothetical protein JNN12_17030 [Bacteroidetes Order II. Incertae sedis bacterium]|nr:hypothetical protein [Bacteroidetes Order II. bacterium]